MNPFVIICFLSIAFVFWGFGLLALEEFIDWKLARDAEQSARVAIDAAQFRRDAMKRDFFNL